ncbi:MAG: hypothetical protein HFJ29_03300 [Clostridia bacterium]|nr:hypothetical protein [Clostridia bacterium]
MNGKTITLCGSNTIIQNEKAIIENLELTGNESQDRLLIQECIDKNKLKSDILYNGNSVYPFEEIIKAYRKLQKSGTLDGLTEEMYHFFIYACEGIAHYNLQGFRSYYNNSFRNLENELLSQKYLETRFSDRDRIFKELKIGKYYNERAYINIDKIPLNKLKSIIENCGWKAQINTDNYLKLSKDINANISYSFEIDIFSYDVSRVIRNLNYISNSFDTESYIDQMVMERERQEKTPTISEIVSAANVIKHSLNEFSSDVLYKCRLEVELNKNTYDTNTVDEEYNLEICG